MRCRQPGLHVVDEQASVRDGLHHRDLDIVVCSLASCFQRGRIAAQDGLGRNIAAAVVCNEQPCQGRRTQHAVPEVVGNLSCDHAAERVP